MDATARERALLAFPQGFLWGTATASHQVEGGNANNDWWAWAEQPGRIADGSRAGAASDWWHRAEDDLTVAAQLGQNSHRLSLEWSRLEPREGAWDEGAVARYRQILSFMRGVGIQPMLTLNHFTLPLWLYERGGWEHDRVVDWFARYAGRAVDAFGDLCSLWCTLNEPMLNAAYGYLLGVWPPGGGGIRAGRRAFRHMAQAHARAYAVLHARQPHAMVGYAKHLRIFDPDNPRRRADRFAAGMVDHLFNRCELHAFHDGTLLFPFGWAWRPRGGERRLDFLGINYYSRDLVRPDPRRPKQLFLDFHANPDAADYIEGWGEVYPEGLYRALVRAAGFGLPLYLTEFGVRDNDDSLRPRFILAHVAAMHRALCDGVDLRGAYFWSLVDNWEWAAGWTARFGLIGLNPATQERTLTRSAEIYRRVAQANGLERALVEEVAPDLVGELL